MSNDKDIIKYKENLPLGKQDFLRQVGELYPSELFPDEWDPEDKRIAEKELLEDGRFINGLWAKIPKTCNNSCPMWRDDTCKLSNKPTGSLCPEEKAYTEILVRYYIDSLAIENTDIASISLVRDLVDVELLMLRMSKIKANQEFIVDQTVAVSPDGYEIVQQIENPIFSQDAKLSKRKQDILTLLAATRKDKLKLIGQMRKESTLDKVNELMRTVETLVNKGQNYGGEIIDADEAFFLEEEEDEQ